MELKPSWPTFAVITNPKLLHNMKKDCTKPTTPHPAFRMTYEQQLVIEDRLVEVFSEVIDLQCAGGEFPVWGSSTCQLMEIVWTLSRMHRIIDHDTHRPMTMLRMATLLCSKLHRPLPANIYSVARQSRLSGRAPVVSYFGQLWYEHGLDLKTFIQWQKPIRFPHRLSRSRNIQTSRKA